MRRNRKESNRKYREQKAKTLISKKSESLFYKSLMDCQLNELSFDYKQSNKVERCKHKKIFTKETEGICFSFSFFFLKQNDHFHSLLYDSYFNVFRVSCDLSVFI